jgi:hypothetical protein
MSRFWNVKRGGLFLGVIKADSKGQALRIAIQRFGDGVEVAAADLCMD